jgi:hypothetical protein
MHLRARLHGITPLKTVIFSHRSENPESKAISREIWTATFSGPLPTSLPHVLASTTLQKTYHSAYY